MNRLVIVGANEFSYQVISIAKSQNKYQVIGYYDDFTEADEYEGLPILGNLEKLESDYKKNRFDYLFLAIGYKRLHYKETLLDRFKHIPLATIIHSTAFVEKDAILEPGVLIYAHAYVGPRVHLKQCVVVNVHSYFPHDIEIEICTFLSGGINIGGKVKIGKRCFIGLGVTINDSINIGDDILLGSNTLVIKSITIPGVYVGSPARKIKDSF